VGVDGSKVFLTPTHTSNRPLPVDPPWVTKPMSFPSLHHLLSMVDDELEFGIAEVLDSKVDNRCRKCKLSVPGPMDQVQRQTDKETSWILAMETWECPGTRLGLPLGISSQARSPKLCLNPGPLGISLTLDSKQKTTKLHSIRLVP